MGKGSYPRAPIDNQACCRDKQRIRGKTRRDMPWDNLALITTEAVLVEVALVWLAPLLLWLATAAITASAAGHLLVRLSHSGAAEASLILAEWLTAGAWACRGISLILPVSKLSLMPLTLR